MGFLAEWSSQIILSLVIAVLTYILNKNIKEKDKSMEKYRELLAKESDNKTSKTIEAHLEPIYEELEDIRKRILSLQDRENQNLEHVQQSFDLIIASYKYRLTQLCKELLEQGFMYQKQYDNLSEFYTLYTNLGGNGQAKDYYQKVCNELEIKPNP